MKSRHIQVFLGLMVAVALLVGALIVAATAHAQVGIPIVGANCKIQWNSNTEADLAKYTVTAVLTPPSGVAVTKLLDVPKPLVAAPTVSTTCLAMGLNLGGTLTVQIEAVDTLGNRSVKSAVAMATQDVVAPTQPTGVTVTPNP